MKPLSASVGGVSLSESSSALVVGAHMSAWTSYRNSLLH